MTTAVTAARVRARRPMRASDADALRALAEGGAHGPASVRLVAQLNPRYPRATTVRALGRLEQAGLVDERPGPLTPLLSSYSLTGAGRRWVRHHG